MRHELAHGQGSLAVPLLFASVGPPDRRDDEDEYQMYRDDEQNGESVLTAEVRARDEA